MKGVEMASSSPSNRGGVEHRLLAGHGLNPPRPGIGPRPVGDRMGGAEASSIPARILDADAGPRQRRRARQVLPESCQPVTPMRSALQLFEPRPACWCGLVILIFQR